MLEMKEKMDDMARTAKEIAVMGGEQAQAATQGASDRAEEATSGVVEAVKEKVHDVTADGTV